MKVRCIRTDPDEFPIDQNYRDYFKSWFGSATTRYNVNVGQDYVVYAIKVYSGFPFYYVTRLHRGLLDWQFVPNLCFEVIDDRVSKLWRVEVRLGRDGSKGGVQRTTLAIKEWIEDAMFFERLVDGKEREVKIMTEAAALMNAEYE